MKVIGIIPARYEATRFPGKLMADLMGKSVLQRAYENCLKSKLHEVWVAADDKRIYDHAFEFGGKAIMTDKSINSGSERCRIAFQEMRSDAEAFINIQGDEPLINAEDINLLIDLISQEHVQIGTLVRKENDLQSIENPNRVKVVLDVNDKALYFSRSKIPFNSSGSKGEYNIHVGMYAFKAGILNDLQNCKESFLAETERLEQLQWLENGFDIYASETNKNSIPVDTPEDLAYIVDNWSDLNK